MIQESKLSSNSKTPSIQNFTTVRKDRRQGQGGGLLTLIHKSINFSRKPESPANHRQRLRTKPSLLVTFKYLPQSRLPTISTDSSPHHTWTLNKYYYYYYYRRLHTPGKLLHRRLPPFPGSSDDDNGHPNTG